MMFMPFHWPQTVIQTLEDVGKMTIPLSMILIGNLLAEISWSDFRQYIKNVYIWTSTSFKLLVFPLSLLVFIFLHIPYPLLVIAILTAGMPSAPTTTVYAQKFGGDASFASFGVLLTTILCTLTIPFLYLLIHYLYPYF